MLSLSKLAPDERDFVRRLVSHDFPHYGPLAAIIETLSMRLEVAENEIADAKEACGERLQPGMTLASAILRIRQTT